MNFKELIKKKVEQEREFNNVDFSNYEKGALMAKNAIIDLLIKINDENYNAHGEHINQSCREEAETIERIINLIKHGNEYE